MSTNLRELGYSRIPLPNTRLLDQVILDYDHEYLRMGHYNTVKSFFGPEKGLIPNLRDTLEKQEPIIDVGCGSGEFAYALALTFPKNNVIGLDIMPEAVHMAKELYQDELPNLYFVEGDVYTLVDYYPSVAGFITSNLTLHCFIDLDKALNQIYGSLVEGGTFYISDVNPETILNNKSLQLVYMARMRMDDETFIEKILEPRAKQEDKTDLSYASFGVSAVASYTINELKEALERANFRDIQLDLELSGDLIIGYAKKPY